MANLVQCRHCGEAVARSAPVCPSCGGTYPGGHDRSLLTLLIMIPIVALIFALAWNAGLFD